MGIKEVDPLFKDLMEAKGWTWAIYMDTEPLVDASVFGDTKKIYLGRSDSVRLLIQTKDGPMNIEGTSVKEVTDKTLLRILGWTE